jgi:hypothetical protein
LNARHTPRPHMWEMGGIPRSVSQDLGSIPAPPPGQYPLTRPVADARSLLRHTPQLLGWASTTDLPKSCTTGTRCPSGCGIPLPSSARNPLLSPLGCKPCVVGSRSPLLPYGLFGGTFSHRCGRGVCLAFKPLIFLHSRVGSKAPRGRGFETRLGHFAEKRFCVNNALISLPFVSKMSWDSNSPYREFR